MKIRLAQLSAFVETLVLLCAVTSTCVSYGQDLPPRIENGLISVYDFAEGNGRIIHDRSGNEDPLDLLIETPDSVRWSQGTLAVVSSASIVSPKSAKRFVEAIHKSHALTIEAWVTPANTDQTGPARIVSLSSNPNARNFTLGQDKDVYDVRLRTTSTDGNGNPSTAAPAKSLHATLTHVAFTRDSTGTAVIFVNGKQVVSKQVDGDLSSWETGHRLSLANELSRDRPWLGQIHFVAIYERALNGDEVQQNFAAGALHVLPAAPVIAQAKAGAMKDGMPDSEYHKSIQPLLASKCIKCHGAEKQKGGLRLDQKAAAFRGGDSGEAAIVPGKSMDSRLLTLIAAKDENERMPPEGEPLTGPQIELLKKWVDAGAEWPETDSPISKTGRLEMVVTDEDRNHWSFRPLQTITPPVVADQAWIQNPVDQFVRKTQEAQGLTPAANADAQTLIRRVYFDVIGLPPELIDNGGMLHEQTLSIDIDPVAIIDQPAAYAELINQLLASPHYGERWARHWLDVARFAESSGFEHDYDRPNAYHYRDFVIQALNRDLPYDQFVRWQLAGDEFEPESPLALMATGFLGAGVFPTQITANEVERTRYDALDDMLATTGTAFLGMTIGCARCHDHKFDPIPTRDYYRMLSTFTTTVRSDIELDLDPERTQRERVTFDREHAPRVAALAAYEERELPRAFDAWIAAGAPMPAPTWELLAPSEISSKGGATFQPLEDGSHLVGGTNADTDDYTLVADVRTPGLRALRLEALAHPSLPHGGPGRADNGNIGLSRIRVSAAPLSGGEAREVTLIQPRATFEQNTNNLSIASALDDNPGSGWAVDPRFGTNHAAVFLFEKPLDSEGGVRITVHLEFRLNTRHAIGRPRLSVSAMDNPALDGDSLPAAVAALLPGLRTVSGGPAALAPADRAVLQNWWKTSDPGWLAVHRDVESHASRRPQPTLTKVLVCAEGYPALRMHTQGGDFLPETHFLHRGSTELKRGVATPGFLQVLMTDPSAEAGWQWTPPEGAKSSGRRRTLAHWMTDANQGAGQLLARVIVNRLWQHHFGQGLVATPNDFGAQGAHPTHPELLDWLAGELIRGGWRLKPIHRLLMNSAVYQADTRADPAALKADPANQLFGRRVPRRLEAEAVRDSLLAASGVLDPTLHGPGTLDPASHRRSIYFTVKRSQRVAEMQAFDAPEPLSSQGTRPTTTVAPQALFLMNSPQVRSWAEAFAGRFAPEPHPVPADAVLRAYAIALNRVPTESERSEALAFIDLQTQRHRAAHHPAPQSAALTDFAQVVLSLNEFIYAE